MVDNSTWAGMIGMNLTLHVYCAHCDRNIAVDIPKLPPDGNTMSAVFRCSTCGRPGSKIVGHQSANYAYPGAKGSKNSSQ